MSYDSDVGSERPKLTNSDMTWRQWKSTPKGQLISECLYYDLIFPKTNGKDLTDF